MNSVWKQINAVSRSDIRLSILKRWELSCSLQEENAALLLIVIAVKDAEKLSCIVTNLNTTEGNEERFLKEMREHLYSCHVWQQAVKLSVQNSYSQSIQVSSTALCIKEQAQTEYSSSATATGDST